MRASSLSIVLLLLMPCLGACPSTTEGADATTPGATTPDATTPDATAPDATAPDATTPDATAPDATAPDATAPDATAPIESSPDPELANAEGNGIQRESLVLEGIRVVRYTWTDSKGLPRSVALKRQGSGNNGGYAVLATYEVPEDAGRTVTVRGTSGGEAGFGYFVAHERYRNFLNGYHGPIASLHGQDDSPLGLDFPVTEAEASFDGIGGVATHTFQLSYPKWGTVTPMASADATISSTAEAHVRFDLPLTIQWTFKMGTDFPRIDYLLDLSQAAAGQLAFDVRGPYGVVEFADGDTSAVLSNVQWGDSMFHFTTLSPAASFLTTAADWTWNTPIGGSRAYNALIARHSNKTLYESGIVETRLSGDSGLVYAGWSENIGQTRTTSKNALLSDGFQDWEWPFQSAQYSGLSAEASTTGKKLAWGSSSLYGALDDRVYLNNDTSLPIVAYPANGTLVYRVCWILGLSTFSDADPQGLTRRAAQAPVLRCPEVAPLLP